MNNFINEISTKELLNCFDKPEYVIIDIRPVDAYNGWKLEGETRGGHIKSARSLPEKWVNYIDWIEIVRSKGILPEQSLVIYGYYSVEAEKVINVFMHAGYKNIQIYNHFVNEWSANMDMAMDYLPNYKQLIYPEWLQKLQSGGNPPEHSGSNYVICHVHYRNPEDYFEGHIPGTISLDTLLLESPETWNRRSSEELKKALQNLGIAHDTTVILYGRFSFPNNDDPFPGSSAGHLGAFRCAFIMMYAGVKDVKMLNGGLQSWKDAGFEITSEETKPKSINNFGIKIPARSELAVDISRAKELLKSEKGDLISIRSWSEFIGELSGYNYIGKKGRIPGAIFGNCGSDAYHMENYRNLDHSAREYHEIAKNWAEAGISPEKHNAFYCGTGWRGSEAFFNAYLMGWKQVSVFDGGWFEWSNDPANPYETGEPK